MKKIISALVIFLLFFSQTTYCSSFAKTKNTETNIAQSHLQYVNMDFWERFNDECLTNYIIETVENNYDLKNATLKVSEYKKFVDLSFGRELPFLGVGVQADWLRSPMVDIGDVDFKPRSTGIYSVPLIVSYEADIFLKNRNKTQSAKKAYIASQFEEKKAYISVASALASLYFNLVQADKLIEIQENIISLQNKNLELTKLKVKEGVAAQEAVNRAVQEILKSQTEYNELKKQQNELQNQLSVLLGKSPDSCQNLQRINFDEMNFYLPVPDSIPSDVIFSRPDVQKIEAELEKAKIDIKIARKELLPTIPIFGVLGFGTSEFSSLFNKNSFFALLGGGALQTIFDGGNKLNNLKLKKIQYEEMFNKYQQTDLVAMKEVNDALWGLKMVNANFLAMEENFCLEEKNSNYADLKYKEGVFSLISNNNAKIKSLSAQKNFVIWKTNNIISYITLYKAVGAKL